MTSFLLLVSFLLHMVTLAVIYQLVKQLKSLRQHDHTDTAALMETYLQEIKEENRMLEANLGDTTYENIIKQKQKEEMDNKQNNESKPVETLTDETFIPSPSNPETEVGDTLATSQQARILQLHDQNFSIKEIASQLHCGKSEVELIIKLHAKTNNNA